MKILKTNQRQILTFLENAHPLTIISDRYNGIYSGGAFLAFPLTYDEIPPEPEANDVDCSGFWDKSSELDYFVGKGKSIDEAVRNLLNQYDNQYRLLGGNPEDICDILGHDFQYNFPSAPTKALCLRCGKRFKADYSGDIIHDDIWKEEQ